MNPETGEVNKQKICGYCFAARLFKRNGPYKVKRIVEKVFRDLKAKIPEFSVLRIGKNFECGSRATRNELIQVLELCVKYNIRPIVTSKILDFDIRVAELVRQANGVIHISLGIDKFELGAVEQGYDQKTRYANAKLYHEAGTKTGVRVVEDITAPMSDLIRKIHFEDKFHILLTPLFYKDKKTFESNRSDITWDEAKRSGIFKFQSGALHAEIVHPSWNSVRNICGLVHGIMRCNNCSLGNIIFSPEVGSSKKKYKQQLILSGWNASD